MIENQPIEDRRASSPKRHSDVLASDYPVVTKAAYDAIVRGKGASERIEIKQLCQLRNYSGQMALVLMPLLKRYHSQQPTGNKKMERKLRSIDRRLNAIIADIPLNIQ